MIPFPITLIVIFIDPGFHQGSIRALDRGNLRKNRIIRFKCFKTRGKPKIHEKN